MAADVAGWPPSARRLRWLRLAALPLVLAAKVAAAQDMETEATSREPWRAWIPFAFTGEQYGLAVGLGGGAQDLIAPGVVSLGAAFVTTNGTWAVLGYGGKIPLVASSRIQLEPMFAAGRYTHARGYFDGNPDFPDEAAGSNDSSPDNYIESAGWDNWLEARFLFPLNDPDRLRSDITHWHLRATPFWRVQTFELENGTTRAEASGIELAGQRDSRESILNPQRGSVQRITLTRDFGWTSDNDPWTSIALDVRGYLPLGSYGWFAKNTLAFDFWTVNVPTWSTDDTPDGPVDRGRPPYYEGATLGGFTRLRAFPAYRFNDHSALYLSAELRGTLRGKPIDHIPFVPEIAFGWWQLVGFVEMGRVAPEWALTTLLSDLKWDGGLGVRALTNGVVLRLDVAVGNEGWTLRALSGHSF